MRGPVDRLGRDLGLEDRRHRLGMAGMRVRHQSNCGVLTAGSWTIVIQMLLRSCSSSVRTESVKPRIANFAPQ